MSRTWIADAKYSNLFMYGVPTQLCMYIHMYLGLHVYLYM